MRRAPVFDHADAARGYLIDHAMVERDDAIRDVLFQAETCQRAVAALSRHDDGNTFFLQPAKEAAEFRAHDALVRQRAEKGFDGIEHDPLRLDRIDRVTEPDEEAFEIVFACFLELAPIDEYVIEEQLLARDELL